MKKFLPTPEALQLLHEGMLALSQVEAEGVRVDKAYLESAIARTGAQMREYEERIRAHPDFHLWRRRYGSETNFNVNKQLAAVIFGDLGFQRKQKLDEDEKDSDGEAEFEGVDHELVKLFFARKKLDKSRGTYLYGIQRELVQHDDGDWYVHPAYHLNTVASFRSSASDPNWTNIPSRNKVMAETIRRCYIARRGQQLLECDLGQIETRTPCFYSFDETLMAYCDDPTRDMHRDVASQLFFLDEKTAKHKPIRHIAKNSYVFPVFYGSYYRQTAAWIWEDLVIGNVKLPNSEKTVIEHLADNGITERGDCSRDSRPRPGTFEHHCMKIDEDFTQRRFKKHWEWKERWFRDYQKNGGCQFLTGFVMIGPHSRNEVTNYAIQGCLHGDTRVHTEHGHIPIRDLVGKCVRVWTGFRWANAVGLDRGLCQRARVVLSSGIVVECDTRHKLKNDMDEWVDVPNFREGDWVALPCNPDPLEWSGCVNWPFVFGYTIGDGRISDPKSNQVVLYGGDKKATLLDRIKSFWVDQGFADGGTYRGIRDRVDTDGRSHPLRVLSLCDRRLAQVYTDAGFVFGWKSHTKRVPKSVWSMCPQDQRDFLEGLWLSDGSRVPGQERNLHMCNLPLLREVQELAAPLGYDSQLSQTKNGWILRFNWRDFNSKSHRKYPRSAIARHVRSVDWDKYDNKNEFTTDKRNWSSSCDPSQYVGERIVRTNGEDASIYRYDRVVRVEILDETENTYTMSVDDSLHQFVAGGVIHKNTSFHIPLWALIKVNRILRRYKFRSRVIGEVHDCLNIDGPASERDDVIDITVKALTVDVRKHWPWINVMLTCEPEACPVDGCWFDKYPLVQCDGSWEPADRAAYETKHGRW